MELPDVITLIDNKDGNESCNEKTEEKISYYQIKTLDKNLYIQTDIFPPRYFRRIFTDKININDPTRNVSLINFLNQLKLKISCNIHDPPESTKFENQKNYNLKIFTKYKLKNFVDFDGKNYNVNFTIIDSLLEKCSISLVLYPKFLIDNGKEYFLSLYVVKIKIMELNDQSLILTGMKYDGNLMNKKYYKKKFVENKIISMI